MVRPAPFKTPVDEMRKTDARLAIASYVGRRQRPSSHLTKATLNSVMRYLTGSFAFPPKAYNTPASPSIEQLREDVVITLANLYYDPFVDMCDPTDNSTHEWHAGRPFRRDELRGLFRALRDHPDRRPD
jgi:hypothetical protein